MNPYGEPLSPGVGRVHETHPWRPYLVAAVSLVAIVFQIQVPLFSGYLSYLELPLLVTVHFALTRKSAAASVTYGAAIGLVQDALSPHPLGMLGIVKTLTGFFAAAASVHVDTSRWPVRFLLGWFFFVTHQVLFWALAGSLLREGSALHLGQTLLFGLLNGAVAVPLFELLDRM
jgi:rod shape-determining protein MreD